MNSSDLELLQMQADALYVCDADDRLLRINELDSDEAVPYFFLSRSLAGNIWRIRYDLADDVASELARLAASEPVVKDLREAPSHRASYEALLQPYATTFHVEAGPSYMLPELDLPTNAVTITSENQTLLQANFPYTLTQLAERTPVVVMVDNGAAIAACYCARITSKVAEAGVYTLEAYRGRGYAAEIVRGWASAVRATGRIALYSTSWENTASRAVAAKLGALHYGATFNITAST